MWHRLSSLSQDRLPSRSHRHYRHGTLLPGTLFSSTTDGHAVRAPERRHASRCGLQHKTGRIIVTRLIPMPAYPAWNEQLSILPSPALCGTDFRVCHKTDWKVGPTDITEDRLDGHSLYNSLHILRLLIKSDGDYLGGRGSGNIAWSAGSSHPT